MKKHILAALALAILSVVAYVATAAIPIRTVVVVSGATNWTNDNARVPLQPLRFDLFSWWTNGVACGDTVTVSRIRGTRTNTLATLTTSGGAGGAAVAFCSPTNYLYLVGDDILRFAPGWAGGSGTVEVVSQAQE